MQISDIKKPILLTLREIGRVTGGIWMHLPEEKIEITGVNFYLPYVSPGDLFVCSEQDAVTKSDIEKRLREAFSRGAVAAVIGKDIIPNNNYPLLVVANVLKALQDLATATSLQFDGVRILVTGSHGKTGFKTQLYHIIRKQIVTHASLGSANKERAVWLTLAAIQQGASVAIVEVAVPARNIGQDRGFFIRPDFCVITGVGLEHMSSHKTLKNLIENKAAVVMGLRPGGRCLLNADDAHYDELYAAVRKNSGCDILTFGSAPVCQGRLVNREFHGFGWQVQANILGEEIEYNLPLIEDYAPLASVSVLLMAKLLGANLQQCVAEYEDYQHFESSGNLFKVDLGSGNFFVYSQTRRGELKGFESMFEIMSRLHPQNGGRKIAVVSEFINFEDNPGIEVDIEKMRDLMTSAGIDLLYTAKEFKQHEAVIPSGVDWCQHGDTYKDIKNNLLGAVRENDMVFLRGVLKAGFGNLVDALLDKGLGDIPYEKIY
ncbi:MAG: Mur ligase family protein [Methylobacter sp.]|nr:Mur ligase family protein [Methylobacter sp.]